MSRYIRAIDWPSNIHSIKFKTYIQNIRLFIIRVLYFWLHLLFLDPYFISIKVPAILWIHQMLFSSITLCPCTCRSLSLVWVLFSSWSGEFPFNILRSNSNITFLNCTSLFKHLCCFTYHTALELLLYKSVSSTRLHAVIGINYPRT